MGMSESEYFITRDSVIKIIDSVLASEKTRIETSLKETANRTFDECQAKDKIYHEISKIIDSRVEHLTNIYFEKIRHATELVTRLEQSIEKQSYDAKVKSDIKILFDTTQEIIEMVRGIQKRA
jgi:energy-converting hydrogenase A subunit M